MKYGVDLLCRPTLVEAGTPSSANEQDLDTLRESCSFHYDELGRLVKSVQSRPYLYGQAVHGFDTWGQEETRTYHYDELNRLMVMTYEDGTTASWEYDSEGNVTRFTDTEGKVTRYEYFRDYLIHKVILERNGSDVGEFVYSYDAAGRLDEIQFPTSTGITAVFRDASDTPGSGFDPNGNIRYLRYEKSGQADPIRRFEWTYDDSNNRESMLDVTPTKAVKWEYGFDWLDRLVTVKRAEAADLGSLPATSLQREYVFDESDNRTFFDDYVNGVTYHYKHKSFDDNGTIRYSDQLEEVLVSSTVADRTVSNFSSFEVFEHDEDGNMTKRTLTSTSEDVSYEWTEFDRLKKATSNQNGRMQDARYDIDGLRERKLDKNGNSSKEYGIGIATSASVPGCTTSTAPSISYISGHMLLGAEIDDGSGSEFVFHLPDALGSTRDVVDSSGNVIRSFEHDEYGNLISSSGSGAATPKTWIGGLSVNDDTADSGLWNMGHRNYAGGVLGRFISRDPIGFSGGLNLYSYPTNPMNAVDPSGLDDSFQDAAVWVSSLFVKEGNSRVNYSKNAKSCVTSADRAALRLQTRDNQSALGQKVTDWLYSRPKRVAARAERAAGLSKGNPTGANPKVTMAGRGMQLGGIALIIYGAVESARNILASDNKERTVCQEVSGWSGSIIAGNATVDIYLATAMTMAAEGAPLGPLGIAGGFAAGLIGSMVGGAIGDKIGGWIYDSATQNSVHYPLGTTLVLPVW